MGLALPVGHLHFPRAIWMVAVGFAGERFLIVGLKVGHPGIPQTSLVNGSEVNLEQILLASEFQGIWRGFLVNGLHGCEPGNG